MRSNPEELIDWVHAMYGKWNCYKDFDFYIGPTSDDQQALRVWANGDPTEDYFPLDTGS